VWHVAVVATFLGSLAIYIATIKIKPGPQRPRINKRD
jgi:hypothetical protein